MAADGDELSPPSPLLECPLGDAEPVPCAVGENAVSVPAGGVAAVSRVKKAKAEVGTTTTKDPEVEKRGSRFRNKASLLEEGEPGLGDVRAQGLVGVAGAEAE
ncbi:hypothetical protein UVI_02044900 [Ustilaginoidea virens]|uniref:Uncharacterized protein n=1 Tax=Ustilaginoidea virens TaxID=1159556 RepID=A0A1B5L1S4_USTVR|nr:hypothetical protein UVI_02044900 [Ustilaginoidea virens]